MGRKPKPGLDYFICDTDWMTDIKFRRAKQKYGYLAPYTYQILLTLIYKDKGYYLDVSDMDTVEWSILEYLQGKYMPSAETVGGIIADLVACGLFSRDLYETEHILTSHRIQEEYYNSTAKRVAVTINKRYWILSIDEMQSISSRSSILSLFISDGRNDINDGRNEINDVRSTQRREDERREDERREDEIREDEIREEKCCTPEVAAICLHFTELFNINPNKGFTDTVQKYLSAGMPADSIRQDISKAALKNPKEPIPYVLATLKGSYQRQQPVEIKAQDQPLADWERQWLEQMDQRGE